MQFILEKWRKHLLWFLRIELWTHTLSVKGDNYHYTTKITYCQHCLFSTKNVYLFVMRITYPLWYIHMWYKHIWYKHMWYILYTCGIYTYTYKYQVPNMTFWNPWLLPLLADNVYTYIHVYIHVYTLSSMELFIIRFSSIVRAETNAAHITVFVHFSSVENYSKYRY